MRLYVQLLDGRIGCLLYAADRHVLCYMGNGALEFVRHDVGAVLLSHAAAKQQLPAAVLAELNSFRTFARGASQGFCNHSATPSMVIEETGMHRYRVMLECGARSSWKQLPYSAALAHFYPAWHANWRAGKGVFLTSFCMDE